MVQLDRQVEPVCRVLQETLVQLEREDQSVRPVVEMV